MNLTKEDVIKGKRFLKNRIDEDEFFKFKDEIKIYILKYLNYTATKIILDKFPDSLYFISGGDFKKVYIECKFKHKLNLSEPIYTSLNTDRKKRFIDSIVSIDFKSKDVFLIFFKCFKNEFDKNIIRYCLTRLCKTPIPDWYEYKEFMRICKLKCL